MTSFSLKQSKLLAGTEFAEIVTDCSSTHYQEELNRWNRDIEVLHSSCIIIVRRILTKALWFFFFLREIPIIYASSEENVFHVKCLPFLKYPMGNIISLMFLPTYFMEKYLSIPQVRDQILLCN